jgi:hypothetical protein
VELYEIDVLSSAMFRDLQKIYDARKAGSARQRWRNVIEFNLPQFIYDNASFAKPVFVANANMRLLPDANTAGNLAALYWFSQTLRELHAVRLTFDLGGAARRPLDGMARPHLA